MSMILWPLDTWSVSMIHVAFCEMVF